MSLYDEMQQVTRELLGDPDFKQGSTQLVKIIPGTGPVDDPGPATEVLHNLDGAVRGVQWSFVQKGLAVGSDLQITHSVLQDGTIPAINDFVQVDGRRYKVMQVINRPSAGVPVAHTLILRS